MLSKELPTHFEFQTSKFIASGQDLYSKIWFQVFKDMLLMDEPL